MYSSINNCSFSSFVKIGEDGMDGRFIRTSGMMLGNGKVNRFNEGSDDARARMSDFPVADDAKSSTAFRFASLTSTG